MAVAPLLASLLVGPTPPLLAQTPVLDAFDLSQDGGEQFRLSRRLEEISGLAVDSAGRLFAHQDERGIVYELDPRSGDILSAFSLGSMGVAGDFEGIAVVGNHVFLSTSSGEIAETSIGSPGTAMEYRVHPTGLGARCEMEGLAYDPSSETLLLPCKTPLDPHLRDHVVVFSVEIGSMAVSSIPRIFLPLAALDDAGLRKSFSPSGIEVEPTTGHLILVSGRDEALLEFTAQGALLGGKRLRKKSHPQAEGITFATDGSLLLADEGQGKRGHLTRYPPVREKGGESG